MEPGLMQKNQMTRYFLEKVSPSLVTVILKEEYQDFTDNKTFLAIKMELNSKLKNPLEQNKIYAFIELPKQLERFIVLFRNENQMCFESKHEIECHKNMF